MKKAILSLDSNSELHKRLLFKAIESEDAPFEIVAEILEEHLPEYTETMDFVNLKDTTAFYIYEIVNAETRHVFFVGKAQHPIHYDHRGNNEARRYMRQIKRLGQSYFVRVRQSGYDEEKIEEFFERYIKTYKLVDEGGTLLNKRI